MIDTDKYEGCQTDRPLFLHKGYLCPTIFMDVDGSGEIVPTLDRRLVDVQADIPEHYLQLLQDAPLLLAEVKRLRGLLDEIDDVVYYNDKKAGQVLPVEKPNLELLRDIMMSYTDEAYQIRGDEGEWIE